MDINDRFDGVFRAIELLRLTIERNIHCEAVDEKLINVELEVQLLKSAVRKALAANS